MERHTFRRTIGNALFGDFRKRHEESLKHFRNAEIELLRGIRTMINEKVSSIEDWIKEKDQSHIDETS